jgi:hypothetical protein
MKYKKVLAPIVIAAALCFGSVTPPVNATRVTIKDPVTNSNKRKTKKPPAEPKAGQAPAGATAECRDGTYSYSAHRRGTCSHHGGVKRWLR